eukprot:g644.t1
MARFETSVHLESIVRRNKVEYTREVLESVFLPFASSLRHSIEEVLIFDVRQRQEAATDGLILDSFIFPKKMTEPIVAELYQPDGSKKTRQLPERLRKLPTEILYDAVGLDLFDQITRLEDEYYLTACEREILETKGDEICSKIPDGASIVELGCGSMTKTAVILDHLRRQGKKGIKFYALDLEEESLRSSIVSLMVAEMKQGVADEYRIQYAGILGTYDQAISSFLKDLQGPKVFLWLGSSIGNYERPEAEAFVGKIQEQVMSKEDLLFIGIDSRKDPVVLARAYNDSEGITMKFTENGIIHLNQLLDQDLFKPQLFRVFAGYNDIEGKNEVYYQSLADQTIPVMSKKTSKMEHVSLVRDELVRIEVSVKYSLSEIKTLAINTGSTLDRQWMDSKNMYHFCLFRKADQQFISTVQKLQDDCFSSKVPTLMDWKEIWKNWDQVTSPDLILDYNEKPIHLRLPFVFYLGHIPCFCDILLSRCLREPLLDPQYYALIFERGIDPIVEDPSQCHSHSEVPEEYPKIEDILEYKARVRTRVKDVYRCLKSGDLKIPRRRLERVLHLVAEHEIMHTETLLYMLVQSKSIRLLTPKPEFLHQQSEGLRPAQWIRVSADVIKIGRNDNEQDDFSKEPSKDHQFGWDNESPERQIAVNAFQIQSRPVSVQEYVEFLNSLNVFDSDLIPASFEVMSDRVERFALNTLYGLVPVSQCSDLPVMISYNQAEAYKNYLMMKTNAKDLRIPTEAQLVCFYQQYLSDPGSLNVGFQNFCPLPMSNEGVHVMGSVWEWTSTVLQKHEGFIASQIYPGYTSDFFDGLHNVVLGGSFATHCRLMGRLRNFYQRSYPYAFIGVRFVKPGE